MSWTWDTTELTFDQTCWTFDGNYDECIPGGAFSHVSFGDQHNYPDRDKVDQAKIKADRELRTQVEDSYAVAAGDVPELAGLTYEDRRAILASDDVDSVIAILLLM
jgi:hypothetical protein